MTNDIVQLIGLYTVDGQPDVTLVELNVHKKADEIKIGDFTQETPNVDRSNWQAPYDEKYLDEEGKRITGWFYKLPSVLTETTRLAFFMYFLDITKPLITPFGELQLTERTTTPERLKDLIIFEEP